MKLTLVLPCCPMNPSCTCFGSCTPLARYSLLLTQAADVGRRIVCRIEAPFDGRLVSPLWVGPMCGTGHLPDHDSARPVCLRGFSPTRPIRLCAPIFDAARLLLAGAPGVAHLWDLRQELRVGRLVWSHHAVSATFTCERGPHQAVCAPCRDRGAVVACPTSG